MKLKVELCLCLTVLGLILRLLLTVVSGAVIQLLTTRSIARWPIAAELVWFNIISYPFNTQMDEQTLICKV